MKRLLFAKKLILFICAFLLLFSVDVLSQTSVTFEWDANTEPDLAGYRIYQSAASGQYVYGSGNEIADIPAGTLEATILIQDGTWYFVATAYDSEGNESGPSNEVTDTFDSTPPGCPANFRIR